jgi:NADH dehydrogenase
VSAPDDTGVVVVSGASGFLGSALCRHLSASGFRVRGLARDPDAARADAPDMEWHTCALPDRLDEAALRGARALVHCAWETRVRNAEPARVVNLEGSRRLLRLCREQGVAKFVFVSSLSAHPAAESSYGRTKLAVEGLLDPERDAAVRPGTIVGEGGIFWRQALSVRKLPFIPLFFGGRQEFQTVALEDVCEGIRLVIEKDLTGSFGLAEVEPVTVREFYAAIAAALGKRPRFLQLPGGLAVVGLQLVERLGFRLPLSSDNLLGLKRLGAFDLADDVRRIGLSPRALRESLAGIRWNRLAPR